MTAPLHGFADVHDYYRRASSRYYLGGIRVPTLVIQSSDDPFIHADSVPQPDELSASTQLELLAHGGHVGFIGGSPARPDYYLERRIPAVAARTTRSLTALDQPSRTGMRQTEIAPGRKRQKGAPPCTTRR